MTSAGRTPHSPGEVELPRVWAAALVAASLLTGSALVATRGAGRAAEPAAPAPQRVAFAGTEHRSLGRIVGTGADATAVPFFADGPDHLDDEVTARGDLVAWVSRRDAPTTEVYVRRGSGPATRVTTNAADECRPAISPDGRWLAYASTEGRADGGHDIVVATIGGGTPRRVTGGGADFTWPTWSPDGRELAYAARPADGSPPQVYRVDLADGGARRVTAEPGGATDPAWDPVAGHRRIAYTAATPAGPQLALVAPDGTGRRDVLPPGWRGDQPAWTADGGTLAFRSATVGAAGRVEPVDRIYSVLVRDDPCTCVMVARLAEDRAVGHPAWYTVPGEPGEHLLVSRLSAADRLTALLQDVRPDGTDPRSLRVPVLREDPRASADPRFLWHPVDGDPWFVRQVYSPDGRQLAVVRFETVDGVRSSRIWLVDADTGAARLLDLPGRRPGDRETDPAWSPDGGRLALSRSTAGAGDARTPGRIEVVRVDTGQRLLTLAGVDGLDDTQPAWSPDGARFAFTRGTYGSGERTHVWSAEAADGTDQRDVTATACGGDCAVFDDSPAYAPDGTRLVFNREADGLVETRPDGSGCRLLLPPGGDCRGPVPGQPAGPYQPRDVTFAPDGRAVVFTARRSAAPAAAEALYRYDPAAGAVTPLTAGLPGRQKEPTWQRAVDVATAPEGPPPVVGQGAAVAVPLTVEGRGSTPAPGVRLTLDVPPGLRLTGLAAPVGECAAATATCALGTLGPGGRVPVRALVVGVLVGTHPLRWSVTTELADAVPADNRAEQPVRVDPPPAGPADPALDVLVAPDPAYVGGAVGAVYTVRNPGGSPATGLRVRTALPANAPVRTGGCPPDGCAVPDLAPGATATVRLVLHAAGPGAGEVAGVVTTTGGNADPANDAAAAPLRIRQPRLALTPATGPPGFAPVLVGVDFPPGRPVRLAWDRGITAAARPVVPAADGTFSAPLLVLHRDPLGARTAVARGTGFGPVAAPPYLVVQPGQQAPGLHQRSW
ncbi:hypothetical protein GCM10010123_45070 [Pilimelia anulata]|uniref:DUF11 domain-containing protein n=1 Tax=Pilimelia anulata TaxID=53371 RepID=A0A8J3BHF7_9ACTN|nr:DUF11 domain-containing protein [Pilimelia anulata]GGK10119.1 hypothetical protein GCM10010123_45070 [Pilimelia anulata]